MIFSERLISQFLENSTKKKQIENLSTADTRTLYSAILATSFVPKPFLEEVQEDPEFQQVISLLRVAKEADEIPDELSQIFTRKKEIIFRKFKDLKISLEQEILKDKREQIEHLLRTGEEHKKQIAESMTQSCYNNYPELTSKIELIDINTAFMDNSISLNPDILYDEEFFSYYAYIILHPEVLTYDFELADEWKDFPLKWLVNQMSPAHARILFIYYKSGQDYSAIFTTRYDDESRFEWLVNQIKGHNFSEFSDRCSLIEEAIECYKQGYYGATISLIIPQIEGVIWDYAEYFNRKFENVYRIEGDRRYLLTLNGKELDNYTVGNLLKQSEFGKVLDQNLLSYFCDELYNERNPIFHGRDHTFSSKFNAAKKLCSFEYVIEQINTHLMNELMKTMNEVIDPAKVDLVLEGKLPLSSLLP